LQHGYQLIDLAGRQVAALIEREGGHLCRIAPVPDNREQVVRVLLDDEFLIQGAVDAQALARRAVTAGAVGRVEIGSAGDGRRAVPGDGPLLARRLANHVDRQQRGDGRRRQEAKPLQTPVHDAVSCPSG